MEAGEHQMIHNNQTEKKQQKSIKKNTDRKHKKHSSNAKQIQIKKIERYEAEF